MMFVLLVEQLLSIRPGWIVSLPLVAVPERASTWLCSEC